MENKKQNGKKTNKEKRVLIGALCVAAVMIAGSTFAWFTSKDEVTNRLSASAAYDVSIAEDFQPPENWIPGQTINKDVSAVNTGNVDAFVRMWLGGQMRLLNEVTTAANMVEAAKPASGSLTGDLTAVNDADKLNLGLTWEKTANGSTPVYYKTLSTEKIDNPKDAAHATATNEDTNSPATFSEVQSVQAGGVLVYAPENAAYHWTLEQATEMNVWANDNTTVDPTKTNLAKGTIVKTGNSTYSESGKTISDISAKSTSGDNNYYGAIDASTFQPETEGLYIFRRNVAETADGTANRYEYSGYYYVPAKAESSPGAGDAVAEQYFALHTGTGANGNSDYVLPAGVINDNSTSVPSSDQVLPVTIATDQKVYLYTASEQVLDTDALTWVYDSTTSGSEKFIVSYNNGTTSDATDDIVIDIALANIGTTSETWTAIGSGAATTFYYNNDVESGDTTTKLVDSVKLADATTQKAYLAFDFDLDVFLESVQVTMDDEGKELLTPVQPWAATAGKNTGANATGTNGEPEINTITWAATT